MLEGLTQVDWKSLKHAYGSAEDTPDKLRLLLSNDSAEQQKAYQHLVVAVHHQETFYSVTPVVVPFLIELLASEDAVQHEWILGYFHALVIACNEHLLWATPYGGEFPIGQLRHEIDTYVQVCLGIDRYLLLLTHSQPDVRLEAAKLLGIISDQSDRSLEPLWTLVETEPDAGVLVFVLNSFARLAAQTKLSDARWLRLQQFALNHDDIWVRWEAAMVFIELATSSYHAFEINDPQTRIPSVLIEMLVNPPIYNRTRMISPQRQLQLLNLLGINGMIRALKVEGLNSTTAHLIIREMLNAVFENRVGKRRHYTVLRTWHNWQSFQTTPLDDLSTKLDYQLPKQHDFYVSGEALKSKQRHVIAAVIDCVPFWQIESNLLSFVFGLPDDREQLAQLLEP